MIIKIKFQDLQIGDEFKTGRWDWKKTSHHAAESLSMNSPHGIGSIIAFDHKTNVEIQTENPNTIFRVRK